MKTFFVTLLACSLFSLSTYAHGLKFPVVQKIINQDIPYVQYFKPASKVSSSLKSNYALFDMSYSINSNLQNWYSIGTRITSGSYKNAKYAAIFYVDGYMRGVVYFTRDGLYVNHLMF